MYGWVLILGPWGKEANKGVGMCYPEFLEGSYIFFKITFNYPLCSFSSNGSTIPAYLNAFCTTSPIPNGHWDQTQAYTFKYEYEKCGPYIVHVKIFNVFDIPTIIFTKMFKFLDQDTWLRTYIFIYQMPFSRLKYDL